MGLLACLMFDPKDDGGVSNIGEYLNFEGQDYQGTT
jgi:hypothetical protein